MQTAFRYLKNYKLISLLAPLFKMLEAICDLLVPLVMADMIDIGIASGDRATIMRSCVILAALAVLGFVVAITAQYFAAKAATYATRDLRADLFSHIMSFSDTVYDRNGSEALITRLTSDMTQVQNGINMFLRLFLRSPFIVVGAMIMAATISLRAAGLFLLIILVLSLIVTLISRLSLPIFAEVQSILERLTLLVEENIRGVRVIRAFGVQEIRRDKFHRSTEELYTLQNRVGKIQAWLNPATYVVVNLGIVVLLYYSGASVNSGSLTQGEVVALLNYLSQILVELIKFASLIVLITKGLASIRRVDEIMAQKPDNRRFEDGEEINEKGEPLLSFEDVSFAYGQGKNAIEHVSFTLNKGETLGILGGTGSGKSTLTRLIRHAFDAGEGVVKLFGKPVSYYKDEVMAQLVAVVPQRVTLFAGTIAENLRLGNRSVSDAELKTALEMAQAWEFVREKQGLKTKVEGYGRNFSGGQRQRLTIARALIQKPRLLILDDSSSALDLATEARLSKALQGERNLTKVIISQRASSVIDADRILVMEDGWCVGLGTHEELLSGNDVYQEIYYAQYPEAEA